MKGQTQKTLRPFGMRDKLGYMFGDFGNDFTFILSTTILMKFYTDIMGVSAGVAYGVSYLSGQPRRNLEVVTTYAPDKRYMGMNNLLDKNNRSYFGLKFAYDTIPNQLVPFDYDAYEA